MVDGRGGERQKRWKERKEKRNTKEILRSGYSFRSNSNYEGANL